jgi:hypothetical protein
VRTKMSEWCNVYSIYFVRLSSNIILLILVSLFTLHSSQLYSFSLSLPKTKSEERNERTAGSRSRLKARISPFATWIDEHIKRQTSICPNNKDVEMNFIICCIFCTMLEFWFSRSIKQNSNKWRWRIFIKLTGYSIRSRSVRVQVALSISTLISSTIVQY